MQPVRDSLDVTVLMPCLNERKTLETCLSKARASLDGRGFSYEILVADNGSSDGSCELAEQLGARVLVVPERGYGNVLRAGLHAAAGRFVVMADSDDSYDLSESHRFVERHRAGAAFVMGCRFGRNGGGVDRGAMPWLHRWIGNPMFSFLARQLYGVPVHDVFCGIRGIEAALARALPFRADGMEFAVEMVLLTTFAGAPTDEIPVRLKCDGRLGAGSHLRTFRDGWRTLTLLWRYSRVGRSFLVEKESSGG